MTHGPPLFIVDAFADKPYEGNPAAVCLLDEPADERWMQQVAGEMNLSETAFVALEADDAGALPLRWFTPTVEVELCGHATLATAHVLWRELDRVGSLRFTTASGELRASERDGMIELDFPATPAAVAPTPPNLAAALGLGAGQLRWTGRSRFDLLVEVDGADALREAAPDFAALARVDARGIIVTAAASEQGVDFVSRFFAPAAGVKEDPVTGSAHCALTPYWVERLGRSELVGYQCSARGGTVRVELRGERVGLAGHAFTTLSGQLRF
jgi:PhzF family phenazine biosynthesis protein